jgi:hypothetical protein
MIELYSFSGSVVAAELLPVKNASSHRDFRPFMLMHIVTALQTVNDIKDFILYG